MGQNLLTAAGCVEGLVVWAETINPKPSAPATTIAQVNRFMSASPE
jgi:hypothetical protein